LSIFMAKPSHSADFKPCFKSGFRFSGLVRHRHTKVAYRLSAFA
jgi:hypothetical protein